QVRGAAAAGGVHPHVQGGVTGVGEAALLLVQLEGGDAEVEEDAGDAVGGVLGDHPVDVVVHGVHRREPIAETGEPGTGELDGLRVPVDADDAQLGEATQGELAVPAHPERRVDQHGARTLDGRGEELEAPVGEHGNVPLGR